ncbi:hypothetical protein Ndes2526A_g07830 [Nannochloris sp. 'desiccata']
MSIPKALASALRWPPFLFSVFCLYWDVAILVLTYRIKWLDFKKKRNDVLALGKGLKDIHRVTILKVGYRELYRKNCMYLCNHRSWADFLVDQYVTEGRTLFVGRWAVAAAFPLVMIPLRAIRCAILFKRGHIADIEGFNKWIDSQFANSPQTGLGVYPEGHRSTHGESLPLKRGMLKYAFSRKLPVQIVIGGNKESILSEKHCTARFYQTIAVGFSEVLKPEEYDDFENFMQKVQETWNREWSEVFSSNLKGLPVLPEVREPQLDYPMDVRMIMAICAVVNILMLAGVAWLTWWAVAAVMALMGPLQWPVAGLVVAYLVASFYVYSKADDVRRTHQKMFQQRKQAPPIVSAAGAGEGAGEENGDKKEQ